MQKQLIKTSRSNTKSMSTKSPEKWNCQLLVNLGVQGLVVQESETKSWRWNRWDNCQQTDMKNITTLVHGGLDHHFQETKKGNGFLRQFTICS